MTFLLPGLAFVQPWTLGLLAFLPLLWRLLRLMPPTPLLVRFPPIRLLLGLEGGDETAERAPLWLVMLRLTLAAVLILAAARPLFDPAPVPAAGDGALVVVVDDGWASARDWEERRSGLDRLLAGAERESRPVFLLTTTPAADGAGLPAARLQPASRARAEVAALEPKPWATDRHAAAQAFKAWGGTASRSVWLTDGIDGDGAAELARTLQALGNGLEMIGGRPGRALLPPAEDSPPDRLVASVRRLASPNGESVTVRGYDAAGAVLTSGESLLAPGRAEVEVPLVLPVELRNRLARLDLAGERSAAATVLLDERWRRPKVGLAGGAQAGAPLLGKLYYVERALAPHADLLRGEVEDLDGGQGPEVLVLADLPLAPGPVADALTARVEAGMVLVRFAGPLLAESALHDPLLPVRLRAGGRALGGAMSWTAPMALAPFPEIGPFSGLAVPADVEVRSQVLAEPSPDLAARTWAALTDGTPLVTARRQGQGWVVLIHTTANAEWSNLALSGLFVDLLRRLTALSRPGAVTGQSGPLAPLEVMDGFGRLHPPQGSVATIAPGEAVAMGPRHPPGFYGTPDSRRAFNLSASLGPLRALPVPPGALRSTLDGQSRAIDLGPALLVAALLLALADGAAVLVLRRVWQRAGMALVLLLLAMPGAEAAESMAVEAALATRLACVRTGDAALDGDCLAGLRGLSQVIAERSTASLAEPILVDVDRDPVLVFPLLYWRVSPRQKPPSAAAIGRLNTYMARGGMIVFDTADEGQPAAGPDTEELSRLRLLVEGLALPPLAPMAADHVLNRAFYLLREVPGRWDGTTIWLEQPGGGSGNDGVSPVVLGGNDWVGAWAVDDHRRPLHAVVPGGERQREMAYRFGVNLVMYALTGNYKADQVHLPAIMERLGK